jgi:hypothetical protein
LHKRKFSQLFLRFQEIKSNFKSYVTIKRQRTNMCAKSDLRPGPNPIKIYNAINSIARF